MGYKKAEQSFLMPQKPKQTTSQNSLKGKLQSHFMAVEQDFGGDAVKWYKSFLAASLTMIVLAILYLAGSFINWWVVFIVAGIAGLSLLFKVLFWSEGSW